MALALASVAAATQGSTYPYKAAIQRENGCLWDEMTCANAAEGGHLKVLRWARENGCPWDENTRRIAASKGYVET